MSERPIILSADEVRSILAGGKTQLRRTIKPQPEVDRYGDFYWNKNERTEGEIQGPDDMETFCPFGQPGDTLWARETWHLWHREPSYLLEADWGLWGGGIPHEKPSIYDGHWDVSYRADWPDSEGPWRSPDQMPRWASRITLEVVNVRAEWIEDKWYWVIAAEAMVEAVA